MTAHGFENRNDVHIATRMFPRQNSSAINKDRRSVQSRHGNQAAWHVLVAAPDGNQAVEAFASGNGFN